MPGMESKEQPITESVVIAPGVYEIATPCECGDNLADLRLPDMIFTCLKCEKQWKAKPEVFFPKPQ